MRGVSMARGKRPDWMIEIAQERMNILFNRAEKEYKEHPERSHRYVELARKISKKYNAKIPQAWGRRKRRAKIDSYTFKKRDYE